MAHWTRNGRLLRALARRARRWADAVLADEVASAGPGSPPGAAAEAPDAADAGPLAHWMEKVRRGAPALWREIQAERPLAPPPPRTARRGARPEPVAETGEASTTAQRVSPRAGPDAGARAVGAPSRPPEGPAAPTPRDEVSASRSPTPVRAGRVEAGREAASSPPIHDAPPRLEEEPPSAARARPAHARGAPGHADLDRARAPARRPAAEPNGPAAPQRIDAEEERTVESPAVTAARRGADDRSLPSIGVDVSARSPIPQQAPAPRPSPDRRSIAPWPGARSDAGATGSPAPEAPARAGLSSVPRAISAEALAPVQPARDEGVEDLWPAPAPDDAPAARWPELPEPWLGEAEPDVELLVRAAERRSRLDREQRGS